MYRHYWIDPLRTRRSKACVLSGLDWKVASEANGSLVAKHGIELAFDDWALAAPVSRDDAPSRARPGRTEFGQIIEFAPSRKKCYYLDRIKDAGSVPCSATRYLQKTQSGWVFCLSRREKRVVLVSGSPCSSVAEHSLGKGEVGSSILPMGTSLMLKIF